MIKLVIPIQKQLKSSKDTTIINIYYWIIIAIHQVQTYLKELIIKQQMIIIFTYILKSRKVGILDLLAIKKYHQKIDMVLKLSVSLESVKKRIRERQIQEKRTDDNEDIAIKRYKNYENSILKVTEYYKKSNLLKVVNGEGSINLISDEISRIIDSIKG